MRTPLFVANWKMNKLGKELSDFVSDFSPRLVGLADRIQKPFEVAIAPQSAYLDLLSRHLLGKPIDVAAQNSGPERQGAFTGENSPLALVELGVKWVILGHSERRHVFGEDAGQLKKRFDAAFAEKLHIIYCVGETLEERRAGRTLEVVRAQLESVLTAKSLSADRVAIAYEPVWAIGTGEHATPSQAAEVHASIREWVRMLGAPAERVRILYGGSVKPANAAELGGQVEIDGFLVGGASLESAAFAEIIGAGVQRSA